MSITVRPARGRRSGRLGAVRRDAFFDVGCFNEDQAWLKDVELGMRLHRSGARLVLDPSIRGKHLKRWTFAEMERTDLFRRGVPWLRLLLSEGTHSIALNLGWRERTSAAASLLVLLTGPSSTGPSTGCSPGVAARPFAAAGVSLHLVHRLTSIAAVPIALAGHLAAKLRRR